MIRDAAAPVVEILRAQGKGGEHVPGGSDLHAAHVGKQGDVVLKAFQIDLYGLIRAESGQHLYGERSVLGEFFVIYQRIGGVVGGAHYPHVKTLYELAGQEVRGGQQLVAAVVDLPGGGLVKYGVDAEHTLELQVRPVVKGVAYGQGNALGVQAELFKIVAVAADEFVVHAQRGHEAPLVVVAAQEQLGRVFEGLVFGYFLGGEVAVVVYYGHLLGVFVVQRTGSGGGKQEILVHELSH